MSNEALTGLVSTWLSFVEAARELDGEDLIPDDAAWLSFMGNGASYRVTYGQLRRALASLPEGAPNPDSVHLAGLIQGTSSAGPSEPLGMNARLLLAKQRADTAPPAKHHTDPTRTMVGPQDGGGDAMPKDTRDTIEALKREYGTLKTVGRSSYYNFEKHVYVGRAVALLGAALAQVGFADWCRRTIEDGRANKIEASTVLATIAWAAELHAKPEGQRVLDGGENGEAGSTKGSKGAAIDEATKP